MTRPANLHAVHACLADTISALQAQGLPVPTALHHAIVVLGRHNLSVERAHKSLQAPLSRTAALFSRKERAMVAKLKPDTEAVADNFYCIEEWLTTRLHEVHDTYGTEALRDVADRLKHSIDGGFGCALLLRSLLDPRHCGIPREFL